jgi:hypothetical protein
MPQTMEEMRNKMYADTLIPGMESMLQPGAMPSGEQLVPGMTQGQFDAQQMMRSGVGSYQPWMTKGAEAMDTAMGSTGPGAATAYMNPYLQNVADTTMTDLNRQFGNQQAQMAQRQIGSGGFAGSATRGAIEQGELARQQGDVSAKALSGLYAGGYQSAMDAAQEAAKTQAGIGQLWGNMGMQAQEGLFGDVGKMWDMGEAERQIIGGQNMAEWQTPFWGMGQAANMMSQMPTSSVMQNPNPILTGIAAAGSMGNLFG